MSKFNFSNVGDADKKLISNVLDTLIDRFGDCVGEYGCDMHHELFNTSEGFIYYSDAEKALEELGVFDCIRLVQRYEKDNFGEVFTDLSDSCKLANMVAYLCGEWLLNQSEHLTQGDCWNGHVTARDLVVIRNEINEALERLNGRDLFDEVYDYYI